MDGVDELNRRGTALLSELAADSDSDCWRQFDALYYEIVWKYLRASHAKLAARVARYLRVEGISGAEILPEEIDEVAHEATKVALRRVREKAARFDPQRGTPTMWVIGNSEYAFVDVAKSIVKARRSDSLVFVAPEDLVGEPDGNPTTEEHVLRHLADAEALEDAAIHVSEKEFAALRLVLTAGYSYGEAAEAIFGDATMTKQVDGLLTRGKRKLAEAWADRKPSPRGARSTNVPDRTDDKEGTDE
jgi:DNA-directed RNA polymerase specialized sigma24 family protein